MRARKRVVSGIWCAVVRCHTQLCQHRLSRLRASHTRRSDCRLNNAVDTCSMTSIDAECYTLACILLRYTLHQSTATGLIATCRISKHRLYRPTLRRINTNVISSVIYADSKTIMFLGRFEILMSFYMFCDAVTVINVSNITSVSLAELLQTLLQKWPVRVCCMRVTCITYIF